MKAQTARECIPVSCHFLYAGTLEVSTKPCMITTVLGSCISVCLWDAVHGIGGMNHFMLPLWNGVGLATPKYGNVAVPALIERMIKAGADRKNIKAKLFGGGSVLQAVDDSLLIGKRNGDVAFTMLKEAGIPIAGSSVGGDFGRKIRFNTQTGEVLMKRIVTTEFQVRH